MSSYDVMFIGTGAGGGTPAHRLAPSGKFILLSALIEGDLASVERAPKPAQAVR